MKMIKKILAIAVVLSLVFALGACTVPRLDGANLSVDPDATLDERLFGAWEFESGVAVYFFLVARNIEFLETGFVTEDGHNERGVWSVDGSTLTVTGEISGTEEFAFTVDGDTLTMTDRDGDTIVYRRP